jgi:V/A-type H+-transporting ATPase subunit A
MVYLQQDAFDKVDASVSLDRQKHSFNKVYELVSRSYVFDNKKMARAYFVKLTSLFKNFNYAPANTQEYDNLLQQIDKLSEQNL